MKYVCNAVDCPKYYLCHTADVVMEPANVLDFRDICDEKHDYPLLSSILKLRSLSYISIRSLMMTMKKALSIVR